jgi:hypothetical protein
MVLTAKINFKSVCNKWESLSKEVQNSLLNSLNYTWSTGEKTPSITVSGKSKEYTVTVSSKCKTYSKSYFYHQSPAYYSGSYPVVLSAPNALVAGSSGLNGKLYIFGSIYDSQGLFFPSLGTTKGIYRSFQMKLVVWDRWGHTIIEKIYDDCGSLYQGDINWDGKDKFGNYVPIGAYVYQIFTRKCNDEDFVPYCDRSHMPYQVCAKRFLFWCLEYVSWDTIDKNSGCGFAVNVIK